MCRIARLFLIANVVYTFIRRRTGETHDHSRATLTALHLFRDGRPEEQACTCFIRNCALDGHMVLLVLAGSFRSLSLFLLVFFFDRSEHSHVALWWL